MKSPRRQFLQGLLATTAWLGLSPQLKATAPKAPRKKGAVFTAPTYFSGAADIPEDLFGDVRLMRKGTAQLTTGASDASIEPILSAEEWRMKAAALRELFDLTLGIPPEGIHCPLSLRVESEIDRGGWLERRVTYLLSPGERTASIMLLPKQSPRPSPAVLAIHPTNAEGKEQTVGRGETEQGALTDKAARRAYGLELTQRGYITFCPDLLGAGERIYPGRRPFDNQLFIDAHPKWSGTGKDLWDLRRALDVMEATPEIDSSRIGSLGHSQGGGLTCYLAAVDERVRVGVSNCGMWPSRIRENPFHVARTSWWTGRPALRAFCWAGKPFPIDIHELLALAAPRPFLNISALNDCGFEASEENFTRPAWENLAANVTGIYQLLDAPQAFQNVLHLDGHDFLDPMRELAYAFLDRHLRPAG